MSSVKCLEKKTHDIGPLGDLCTCLESNLSLELRAHVVVSKLNGELG